MFLFFLWITCMSFATESPYLHVLGVAQDAGHPQMGCSKACCAPAWENPSLGHAITSLGIVDKTTNERWVLDASPDFPAQFAALNQSAGVGIDAPPTGILLTHAHIGHYTGLMFLGRESMGSDQVPVYAMNRMESFLRGHGPWEQLVKLENIRVVPLKNNVQVALNQTLSFTPILVPHRDEYSETVGYIIHGPNRNILYLPDVDKWERMKSPTIEALLARVDLAFVDGTFMEDGELPGRAMSEIPHPFVQESIARFAHLPQSSRAKIHFIHFNHTNPLLQPNSKARKQVSEAGMHLAVEGSKFPL
jgi:pyrroloquinoline quinone biosynthesis protein B